MQGGVLIDTSAWIEVMRPQGDASLRLRFQAEVREGRARLCDLVLLELWNGVAGKREQRWLSDMERLVPTVPTDAEVWTEARSLAQTARRHGLTIPATDLIIAACARVHRLDLLHRDTHFDRLADLLAGES